MKNNIYTLTETLEGTEGIREFQILAVSFDIERLKNIMKDRIDKDEYDLIKDNGINVTKDLYFETNFNDGFVGYAIIKNEIL